MATSAAPSAFAHGSRFGGHSLFIADKKLEFKGGTIQFVGVTTEKAQYLDLEQLAMAALAVD